MGFPRGLLVLAAVVGLALVAEAAVGASARGRTPLRGADVSSLPWVEATHPEARRWDLLHQLASHGADLVRLRLWHSPPDGHGGLPEVLELAARARADSLRVLLDLHLSDTWADPGHQEIPLAWRGRGFDELVDSVQSYTASVARAFVERGIALEAVQVGNEVTAGLLFPMGALESPNAPPGSARWARFGRLLRAGYEGIRSAFPAGAAPAVLLHYDRGTAGEAAEAWFLRARSEGVDFDGVALSYYPWWHGSLASLAATVRRLGRRLERDVWIVETAYPWTLDWFDDRHNPVGEGVTLPAGWEATEKGQRQFLAALTDSLAALPRCRAWIWFEPAWLPGGAGSPWENCTLWRPDGTALPALDLFRPRPAARRLRAPRRGR